MLKRTISKILLVVMLITLFTIAPSVTASTTVANGSFESGNLTGWTLVSGDLATQPTQGRTIVAYEQDGNYFVGTSEIDGGTVLEDFDDTLTGTIVSNDFIVTNKYMKFLISGGSGANVYAALVRKSDGIELIKSHGVNNELMQNAYWDLSNYQNVECFIKIVDNETGAWGHINVDNFVMTDVLYSSNDVSLLDTQIGFQTEAVKTIVLRSALSNPTDSPTGKTFNVVDKVSNNIVHTGTVSYWGEKWGSYWWQLDFTDVTAVGTYYVDVLDAGDDMRSNDFVIADYVLSDDSLVTVAMDQLDGRIKEGEMGWRDCGTEIREFSSHVVTIHGLIDIYENSFERLSAANQVRLIDMIKWAGDYMVFSQETTSDPETNGRFNHDAARLTPHNTTDYYNWHDMAYGITGLVRAYEVMKNYDVATANSYLAAAEKAYDCATYRPYQLDSEFRGLEPIDNHTAQDLARKAYDKPSTWTIPTTLRTKDKLTFVWACTLLYETTMDTKYKYTAIEYADSAAERQFVDFENPIDGVYGNFYEFEGDDDAFLLEWGQNHRWHMGNIEPTNLKGFMDLVRLFPEHPDVAKWYNVVKIYGDNYVKGTADLTPFEIYPVTVYKNEASGGVSFFKGILHGATALYGQIAKNQMEIGDFLQDNRYQELASQNIQFVVGLNPGMPNAYDATSWEAESLLKGIGTNSFPGYGSLVVPPIGSGMNGFSAFGQFATHYPSEGPDQPAGIFDVNNNYYFNEDYLPHSHGYVSGVTKLEDEFTLAVSTTSGGVPVDAEVKVYVPEQYTYNTGIAGHLTVDTLPLQRTGTIDVTYMGKTISRSLDTIASGSVDWDVDFEDHIEVELIAPNEIGMNATDVASIRITNNGTTATTVSVNLSASGATLGITSIEATVNPGSTYVEEFCVKAGDKVMPYLIYASAASTHSEATAIGEGKIKTLFETNLTGWTDVLGTWEDTDGGKKGTGYLDALTLTSEGADDFTYSADIKVTSDDPTAGALVFRSGDTLTDGSYICNVSTENGGTVKLFKLPYEVIATYETPININTAYNLKVEANGNNIKVYLNHGATPIMDVVDNTYANGKFGLLAWQGTAEFQNVYAEYEATKVDDRDASVIYVGLHGEFTDYFGYYNDTISFTDATGSYAEFSFTGTEITWYGVKNNDLGIAEVYVDGVLQETLDCYNPTGLNQIVMYSKDDLSYGTHTIRIVQTDARNPLSVDNRIVIDAFEYK